MGVVLVLGNLAVPLLRSTIPLGLDGTVTKIQNRVEKHPGIDDVHLVTIGGQTLVMDRAVAGHLDVGDTVQKDAWSRTLRTQRETVKLSPSSDVWGMVITMPLVILLCGLLLWPPRRVWARGSGS
jgi:hypothetical protein